MPNVINFTDAVDQDLLKRAQSIAAQTGPSVEALFDIELRYLVETFEKSEAGGHQNDRVLLDFSLGRIDDKETRRALNMDSAEDLFLYRAQAHLPMPH